jgi:Zn-dependent protease
MRTILSFLGKERKIAQLFNVPIRINGSFLLMMLFGLILSIFYGPSTMVMLLIVFGSVVIHEFGHIFAARRYGIETRDVLLHILGGAARMNLKLKNGTEEIVIAIAGPATSLVLSILGLLFLLLFAAIGAPAFIVSFFQMFTVANVFIAVFNLLPAFPMDGGRILRGALWKFMGIRKATDIAILVAKGFAVLMFFMGIFMGTPSYVLLAWFLWFSGQAEREALIRTNQY